jgi:AAA-like domain/CHAT domain
MYGLICKNNCDTVRLFEGEVPVTVSEVPKTKILIWTANPKGQAWLRLENEVRAIRESWERATLRSNFQIVHQCAVRTDDLQRSLREVKPQIVHFAGHGTEVGELVLENVDSEAHRVTPEALVQLFRFFNHENRPKCVLLNACCSSSSGLVDRIHEYINCVIGINGQIEDSSAIAFAGGFYDALFNGNEPSNAFEDGCISLALKGMPGEPALRNTPSTATSTSATQPIETEPMQNSEITQQFYVMREGDQSALDMIKCQSAVTLKIKGVGKTFLLPRIQNAAKQVGKTVVVLDFKKIVDRRSTENEDTFYKLFCRELTDQLRKGSDFLDSLDTIWQGEMTNSQRCASYMTEHILPMHCHLVLVMEEVDIIYDMKLRSDFFAMLRSWHDYRGWDFIWKKLDLVILHEMEPLIDKGSPFSVKDILLSDFTLAEVQELNNKHGSPLGHEHLQKLHELLNGHPALVQMALSWVAYQDRGFESLRERRLEYDGPFGQHLHERLNRVSEKKEWKEKLRQIIRNDGTLTNPITRRLIAEGLIRYGKGEHKAIHVARCELYREFFERHLE